MNHTLHQINTGLDAENELRNFSKLPKGMTTLDEITIKTGAMNGAITLSNIQAK